eukprot:364349-Chlamydomonas_euryale.AAC.3
MQAPVSAPELGRARAQLADRSPQPAAPRPSAPRTVRATEMASTVVRVGVGVGAGATRRCGVGRIVAATGHVAARCVFVAQLCWGFARAALERNTIRCRHNPITIPPGRDARL